MGLSISFGDTLDEADLRTINRVLKADGLPEHVEPEGLSDVFDLFDRSRIDGMPYPWIHYLRRAVAYARQAPEEFGPLAEGEDTAEDDRLVEEYMDFDSGTASHLICHSDWDGFYVPIDFPGGPLFDSHAPGGLGSCQRALVEVVQAAPLLEIELVGGELTKTALDTLRGEEEGEHPLWIERYVWFCLYEKFRLSVEHATAVVFH